MVQWVLDAFSETDYIEGLSQDGRIFICLQEEF
jgi:hypothetical protein